MLEIASLAELAPDYLVALGDILSFWHKVAMCQTVPEVIDESVENYEDISNIANQVGREDVQLFYQICLMGQNDLKMSPDTRAAFEMVMLRALAFQPESVGPANSKDEILLKNKRSEMVGSSLDFQMSNTKLEDNRDDTIEEAQLLSATDKIKIATMENPIGSESHLDSKDPADAVLLESLTHETWLQLHEQIDLSGSLAEIASHCSFSKRRSNELNFVLGDADASLYNPSHQAQLGQALSDYFGTQIKVIINIGTTSKESPRSAKLRKEQENQREALEDLNAQPDIIEFKRVFNGKVNIKPALSEE